MGHIQAVSDHPNINCRCRNEVTSGVSFLALQSRLLLPCYFGRTGSVHLRSVSSLSQKVFWFSADTISVSATIRNTTPLHHLESTSDHLELPERINRQPIRFCRLQRLTRMHRSTIHDKPRSQRPIDLLGFRRCWIIECCPSRSNGHVLAERPTR